MSGDHPSGSGSGPSGLGLTSHQFVNELPELEDVEFGGQQAHGEPRTPPRISSPSIPSPLSLHHLGISPLSPLRRQFSSASSSPAARQSALATANDNGDSESDGGNDQKDVLIQRLTDMAERLSRRYGVDDVGTSALHAKMDEMETVLAGHGSPKRRRSQRRRPTSLHLDGVGDERESVWGPASPSWFRSRFSDMSLPALAQEKSGELPPKQPSISPQDAARIASEAGQLNAKLSSLMANLKARQEESEVSAGTRSLSAKANISQAHT